MSLFALNQNNINKFDFSTFMKSNISTNFNSNIASSNLYATKGEPTYMKDMDTDNDGNITMDEFREYCKANDISTNEMKNMLELRMAYKMSQDITNQINNLQNEQKNDKKSIGNLDLIYAEKNDSKYDENMDTDGDSKISYKEYLRYCEQNSKTATQHYDTKIKENSKSKFMTVSYGKVSNAYNKTDVELPELKVEELA